MEPLRLDKNPEIRHVQPWNVSRQPPHVPRQRHRQTGEQALPAHPVLWVQTPATRSTQPVQGRLYRAILDKAGAFTYRLLTEQLILSLNHPREGDGTRRFCSGPPRLLLQPLAGPARFPHGGAYDRIQEEGLFS